MKIGLSYSRCILDIIEGRVNIDDVLVLITRTDFNPNDDDHWKGIWIGYGGGQTDGNELQMALVASLSGSNPEWYGYGEECEQQFRDITVKLYNAGKIHQPRQFGARPARRPEIWLETVLPPSELDINPVVKKAWDHFQTVAGLTNTVLDKNYQ